MFLNQCTIWYQDCEVEQVESTVLFSGLVLCVQRSALANSAPLHFQCARRSVLCYSARFYYVAFFFFCKQQFLPVVLVYGLLTLWNTTNKSSSFPCKSPQMVTCFDMAVDAWFKLGKRFSRIVASFNIPATYFACRRLYCVLYQQQRQRHGGYR